MPPGGVQQATFSFVMTLDDRRRKTLETLGLCGGGGGGETKSRLGNFLWSLSLSPPSGFPQALLSHFFLADGRLSPLVNINSVDK